MAISKTQVVKFIRKGDKGEPGLDGSSYTENLLLKSGVTVENSKYPMTSYYLVGDPEDYVDDDEYTITIWGELGRDYFAIYNSGGSVWLSALTKVAEDVYSAKFKWRSKTTSGTIASNKTINVYAMPYSGNESKVSRIDRIKLERGSNTNPVWTPAAEEMVAPTITETSVTYAKTTSASQPADSAFTFTSIAAANVAVGEYLWTKTVVTYSDGKSTKSYSVGRIGADGSNGQAGAKGEDGKTTYVHYAYANSADGSSGFSTTYFSGALYVGVCTDYNVADPTTYKSYEWARLKGDTGDKGDPGDNGADYSDNLLLKSAAVTTNSTYNIASYNFAEPLTVGKTYTLTIWGTLADTKSNFRAYNSQGNVLYCILNKIADGVYSTSFEYTSDTNLLRIYAYPSSASGTSTINKIKLEEGANSKPVWTPSTAEMIGERGPAIRGPRDWGNTQPSYTFYSGAAGEPFIDLVVYDGYYYLCKVTHGWNSNFRPGTTNGASYWQLASDYEAIATKILLAEYALVKNLGVTAIEMTSSSGAVLFTAKDGAVTCNTGNFKNINISGTSVFTGLVKKSKTVVNSANFSKIFTNYDAEEYTSELNFEESGTWLDIQYLPGRGLTIYPKGIREIVGNTMLIYNRSGKSLAISAAGISSYDLPLGSFNSVIVDSGKFISMEWKIGVFNGKEEPYFVYQHGAIDTSLD